MQTPSDRVNMPPLSEDGRGTDAQVQDKQRGRFAALPAPVGGQLVTYPPRRSPSDHYSVM